MKFVCTCGEVIVDQTDFLSDKAHQDFDDWAELERAYHALFSTLLHQGLVRSAFLSKNGEMLHQWTHEEPSTSASQSPLSHWWRRWWKSPTR